MIFQFDFFFPTIQFNQSISKWDSRFLLDLLLNLNHLRTSNPLYLEFFEFHQACPAQILLNCIVFAENWCLVCRFSFSLPLFFASVILPHFFHLLLEHKLSFLMFNEVFVDHYFGIICFDYDGYCFLVTTLIVWSFISANNCHDFSNNLILNIYDLLLLYWEWMNAVYFDSTLKCFELNALEEAGRLKSSFIL